MTPPPVQSLEKPLIIGLAGCGKMGAAMAISWAASYFVQAIDILDPSPLPAGLKSHDKIGYDADPAAFAARAARWDILVLAVKPQTMDDLCAALAASLPPELCILSIAAGKPVSYFEAAFGQTRPIIRAMPNTPAAIGKGMSVALTNAQTGEPAKAQADFLLSCLGKVEWLTDETLMDAVTALSGSGPAYVFHLIEALAEAGAKNGLPAALAMALARQTVIGAAALAESEENTPAASLRENVTSPNGTTAAGLEVLMDGRFQDVLNETLRAAAERSQALSGTI